MLPQSQLISLVWLATFQVGFDVFVQPHEHIRKRLDIQHIQIILVNVSILENFGAKMISSKAFITTPGRYGKVGEK